MSLSNENNSITYEPSISTSVFDFPYPYFATSDIKVRHEDSAGNVSDVSSTLFEVEPTNGSLESGCSVTFDDPYTSGDKVTIYRDVPYTQEFELQAGASIPPTALNVALDRTVAQSQQIIERQNRSLSHPITDDAGLTYEAPSVTDRASKFTGWDASGNIEAKELVSTVVDMNDADVIADGSTKARNLSERFADVVNVLDFGADNTGGTDSKDAVAAMAAAEGFVRFGGGAYKLTTCTIDVPVFFDANSYVTAESGQTVAITDRIESPRQFIFRGDGDYAIGHDDDSGEDARQIHVSWFGAFPVSAYADSSDQAPAIQKAFDSVGNTRESVVDFDVGNYYIGTAMTVTRGCWVRGSGTRRTVFRLYVDGFDVFTTEEQAVRFSDIQFELEMAAITSRANSFITIEHDRCEIYDVFLGNSKYGIIVDSTNCHIENVKAIYGSNQAGGSSLIQIKSGSLHTVKNLLLGTSGSYSPDALIDIGTGASGNISQVFVDNVAYITPCIGVLVNASGGNISRLIINNIRCNAYNGTPDAVVKISTSSTYDAYDTVINGIVSSDKPTSAVHFDQASSGGTTGISVDNVVIAGSTGSGIKFVESAGDLSNITIGPLVDVKGRTTPFDYTGTVTGIIIAPSARVDGNPAVCFDGGNVADDAVYTIDMNVDIFSGQLIVTAGHSEYAIFAIRAAVTPAITEIIASTNIENTTGILAGTTGTDAKITVSVDDDGLIYIENRLGSSQRIQASLLTGIK